MYSLPYSFTSPFHSQAKPPNITRLPNSLTFTQEVFDTFSPQQILQTIFNDIQEHSKPQPPQPKHLNYQPKLKHPQYQEPILTQKQKIFIHKSVLLCTCKKSQCSNLYCECFATGNRCKPECKCLRCENRGEGEQAEEKRDDMVQVFEKQSEAFFVPNSWKKRERGCACMKTKCEKKNCNCFSEGVYCTKLCKCLQCTNGRVGKPSKNNRRVKRKE